ncbi:MAG: hypothetical protein ACE5FF_08450 [Saprospiraceae bacterium]
MAAKLCGLVQVMFSMLRMTSPPTRNSFHVNQNTGPQTCLFADALLATHHFAGENGHHKGIEHKWLKFWAKAELVARLTKAQKSNLFFMAFSKLMKLRGLKRLISRLGNINCITPVHATGLFEQSPKNAY